MSNVRVSLFVLALGALMIAPGAAALAADDSEAVLRAERPADPETPQELTVGAPDASLTFEGHEIAIDSGESLDASPWTLVGSATLHDLDVDIDGPQCKLGVDMLNSHDEAQRRCQTGGIRTNAGLDLVEIAVDLVPVEADETGADESRTQATSTMLADMPATGAILLAAAAAGASAGALYAAWRLLKWTGLAAFIPLYSHISDDEILDDPNRAAIYRLIQEEAGIATKTIADRLDLAWGTVTHHLTKLEKRRFVVSKKYGKYRRYFANGAGGTELKDEIAVLRLDRTGDVAALIRAQPGLTQKEVSDVLGVSSSTILWHVKRLEQVQLVRKVRDGKMVRYFPADGIAGVALVAPA